MKFVRFTASLLIPVSLFFVCSSAVEARAQCKTQGALALALAQILNFTGDSQDVAIEKLNSVRVGPLDGWKPDQCLTDEVVIRVEESIRRATTAGRLGGEVALGALENALRAIGALEFIPALTKSLHFLPYREQVEPARELSTFRPPD